ncbi:hypothetical protein O3M35_007141 [Rhynocoris fuscipes]|uniref:Uncharacterized protein n=1 Tax=Rhynocoris fuscipes TaxID=488301 RepID=A0AAW1D941_9HEMI
MYTSDLVHYSIVVISTLVINAYSLNVDCNVVECTGVSVNSGAINQIEYFSFINKTENEIHHSYNWIWPGTTTAGIWDVLYKEEQITGVKSGRNVFVNKMNISLYINWIYSGGKLAWTSTQSHIPQEIWNVTLCHKNSNIIFVGADNKWILTMGNVTLDSTVGAAGSIEVGPDFLALQAIPTVRRKRSPQSDAEEVDDNKKETVWNRLKGYFRELFDRGPNDQRGWLTRLADWILGFLERLLSR